MDIAGVISIVVAAIAAASAYASQRASARASVLNTSTSARVDMEREAYLRAREFDTETIRRQDGEIDDLRQDNKRQEKEIRDLRIRMAKLERLLRAKGMTIPEDD